MKKFFLITIFIFLTFTCFAETITFSSDNMKGTAGDKSSYTLLEGNAKVTTDSMNISADKIELTGDDFRYIKASGNITGSITESGMDFTCGTLSYDREVKIATLENAVHLVDTQNDVTADAQLIEYNQNTSIAVMQISVTLKQKDNTCTSAYAIYRKDAQLLDMSGNPKIVQGQDTFRAQTITLDLNTQEITLDGRVQGSVTTGSGPSKQADSDKKNEVDKESTAESGNNATGDDKANNNADTTSSDENTDDKTNSTEASATENATSSTESTAATSSDKNATADDKSTSTSGS